MSHTAQHHGSQVGDGLEASGEQAPESDELSSNVLGLIGAYRMGAALDAQDLFAKRTNVSGPDLAAVVAA